MVRSIPRESERTTTYNTIKLRNGLPVQIAMAVSIEGFKRELERLMEKRSVNGYYHDNLRKPSTYNSSERLHTSAGRQH